MPRRTPFQSLLISRQLEMQVALGRSATQVDLPPDPASGLPEGISVHAGPRTVLVSPGLQQTARTPQPWQLYDAQHLDSALRALHAQIFEDAQVLEELLCRSETAGPETPPPRATQRRLRDMLALRSLLELAASWQEAATPGGMAPGWHSGPRRVVHPVLPWHLFWDRTIASDAWHLHDLRRWHWPRGGSGTWAQETARHIACMALLQDVVPLHGMRLGGPLAHDQAIRLQQRKDLQRGKATGRQTAVPPTADRDPEAFVRRARLALSAVLEPALAGFEEDEVLQAVQGTRSGPVALIRLLPGVAHGPVLALADTFRRELNTGGHVLRGEGARPAQAAGSALVRRSSWTAARAGGAHPSTCLAVEAAAGPLHLLLPGLQNAGPANPLIRDGLVSPALEEVCDLFSAVAALPAEQTLPLPDLSGLLTGRGLLRLGSHAAEVTEVPQEPAVTEPAQEEDAEEWRRYRQVAIAAVPGLPRALAALQVVNERREQNLARLKAEACTAAGISELDFDEATSGEQAFGVGAEDLTLERVVTWSGGMWFLQLARHPQELVSDGKALSHCVGWGGYAQAVHSGRARIVRVLAQGHEEEHPLPILTLELKPAGVQLNSSTASTSPPGWQLHQARGSSNRLPTRDEGFLLALWAREVGVKLEPGGEVTSLTSGEARTQTARLAVRWRPGPQGTRPPEQAAPNQVQLASTYLAAAKLARWTPAATRVHQEGLRRIAQLVERARSFLETELTRLHTQGDELMVGRVEGDSLLSGTGTIQLPPDPRPLLQALTGDTGRVSGLRARRRLGLDIDRSLQATEQFESLELRPGKTPGEVRLVYERTWRSPLTYSFSPAALRNTGVLDDPLAQAEPPPLQNIAARRQPPILMLRALLDEPLGEWESGATAVTGQPGGTLRLQLEAWSTRRQLHKSIKRVRQRGA